MDIRPINCSKCNKPLPPEIFNRSDFTSCPSCTAPVLIKTFPALQKDVAVKPAENVVMDAEASCFFHPQKKAVVPCATCGRFLCSLCDIEFAGAHICAACLEAGKKKSKIKNLETHRILYDNIALATAIIPSLFIWPTIITAPISIYIALRYWKAPSSIIPRTKIRSVLAIIIAGGQIAGWTYFFTSFIK